MLGDLEPLIHEAMAEWQIPGLAIAVVLNDEPILVKTFGQRDVEAGSPVTTETQFVLCSGHQVLHCYRAWHAGG